MSQVLGLYVPGESIVHRARSGHKLLALLVLGLAITIPPPTWWLLSGIAVLIVSLYLIAGLGLRPLGRQLWALKWLVIVVLASQLIFLPWPVAVANSSRMVMLILVAALVTLTTRTRDILSTLERGLAPLRRFGINPERVSLVLAMTIRTVPVIAELAEQISDAQRARGGRYSIRAFVVPLLVGSLRQADALADALVARGMDD